MLHIEISGKKREGKEYFKEFDRALYAKKVFGMFGVEEQIVKLECSNNLAGVIIDRFGKNIRMSKLDENHFTVNVKVAVSRHFLAWVIALGEGVRIVGPEEHGIRTLIIVAGCPLRCQYGINPDAWAWVRNSERILFRRVVDGQLLQMNKSFNNLKMKQKEKIKLNIRFENEKKLKFKADVDFYKSIIDQDRCAVVICNLEHEINHIAGIVI